MLNKLRQIAGEAWRFVRTAVTKVVDLTGQTITRIGHALVGTGQAIRKHAPKILNPTTRNILRRDLKNIWTKALADLADYVRTTKVTMMAELELLQQKIAEIIAESEGAEVNNLNSERIK